MSTKSKHAWDGQIPEEAHIAIHFCKRPDDIERTKNRIKEYGDRRVREALDNIKPR